MLRLIFALGSSQIYGKSELYFGFQSAPGVNPKSPCCPILDSTDEQAPVSLQQNSTADVEGGCTKAVIIEDG